MAPTMGEAVIHAIAAEEGVEPTELDSPLADVIDPDALETIFQADTGVLTFEFCGYRVTVDHEQRVEVEKIPEREPAAFQGSSEA